MNDTAGWIGLVSAGFWLVAGLVQFHRSKNAWNTLEPTSTGPIAFIKVLPSLVQLSRGKAATHSKRVSFREQTPELPHTNAAGDVLGAGFNAPGAFCAFIAATLFSLATLTAHPHEGHHEHEHHHRERPRAVVNPG